MASLISCRWDWCRSSFPTIDALDTHVKHDHIWPMKPMRKADIALMRRMDLQSLHSSQNTDSSIISKGLIAGVSRNKTPPVPHTSTLNQAFDPFIQLSSPPQVPSPKILLASPTLERLMRQNEPYDISAAVEIFKRTRKIYQRLHLLSHQRSPTHRPLSESSGSSQEVVEQQLTQEVDVGSQPELPLPSEPQIENDLADVELRWPTDDELVVAATEETDQPQGISPDPARGRNFRHGSLNVPLGVNNNSASPHASESQGSHSESQPIVLQTQAPYSSQTTGWSQT